MSTVSAFAGSFHQNPFLYQQFHLRALKVIRVAATVFLEIIFNCCPCVTTLKAQQFSDAFPIEEFQSQYNLVSDLSSLQDAAEQLH